MCMVCHLGGGWVETDYCVSLCPLLDSEKEIWHKYEGHITFTLKGDKVDSENRAWQLSLKVGHVNTWED